MTKTVKGAGRARHAANARHAQRTPLPPKIDKHEFQASTKRGYCLCGATRGDYSVHIAKVGQKRPAGALGDLMDSLSGGGALPATPPAVKPKPTRKRPTRTEIIKEAVAEQAAANAVEKTVKVSKAQMLALAAEEAGWKVERIVDGSRKTLRATRGEEVLEASWDNDISCRPLGFHEVAGRRAEFRHVTVAMKLLAVDPDVALANAAAAVASRKAPRSVTQRSLATAVSFNVATATDAEVLAALAGREVTWRNDLSNGEITESGIIPLNGKQTKIAQPDLDDLSTRQLTFCDADGGGYYSLRISAIIGIGALKDANGHMLMDTRSRAADAMREGRK